jgi:carbonic anhydrase/acetyltransferase-like protein (isoleucine patch superfamily)
MNNEIPDLRPNPAGDVPCVDSSVYIDPTAQVIGNVHIGAGTFVGPTAVLRADEADVDGKVHPILIGPGANVQDGVIVHALKGTRVVVGKASSLSHGAVVHGPAEVGAGCFIGFRAVVFNAVLGDGVYVGSAAVVQNVRLAAGALVPPGRVILTQDQADALGQTGTEERRFMQGVVAANVGLAAGYMRSDLERTQQR